MFIDIIEKTKKDLGQALQLITDDLKRIKTGRAKPDLVEDIRINAYGAGMSLKELASISVPDFHTLLISPWDKGLAEEIEKGISASDLNLHPVRDNDLIRIQVPALTEETRKDLIKLAAQKIESAKKIIRQIRVESKKKIDEQKGEPGVSEDDLHLWEEKLQDLIDEYIQKLDDLGGQKEKELMTI